LTIDCYLGDLVEVVGGGTPDRGNPAYWGGSIPWVSVKDLKDDRIGSSQESITELGLKQSASNLIPPGNILIATRMALGKAAINDVSVAINQDLKALLVADEKVDRRFLFRFLQSRAKYLESRGKGATVKGITLDIVNGLKISLPDLSDQIRVADTLDNADSIRKKCRETLALADEFLQSVFLDMFGDPATNPRGWSIRKLSDLGTLERGKSRHRPRDDEALYGGPYPFIQTGDVANSDGIIRHYQQTYSEAGLQQSRIWPAGTLCITIAANIGKTGILGFDACFPDSVVGFTPGQDVVAAYIQFWLNQIQKELERVAPQSAQKNINLEILARLDVPVPPRNLQTKFSSIVEHVRQGKQTMVGFSREADLLFQSLQQQAFA
jgi:type I restriction enzyme S subunit